MQIPKIKYQKGGKLQPIFCNYEQIAYNVRLNIFDGTLYEFFLFTNLLLKNKVQNKNVKY